MFSLTSTTAEEPTRAALGFCQVTAVLATLGIQRHSTARGVGATVSHGRAVSGKILCVERCHPRATNSRHDRDRDDGAKHKRQRRPDQNHFHTPPDPCQFEIKPFGSIRLASDPKLPQPREKLRQPPRAAPLRY